jgi:PAS domain S-box-containing protein
MERAPTDDEIRALAGDDSYAVIFYNADFVLTGWSRGAALLFGWTAEEALGRTTAELINLPATAQEQAKVNDLRRRLRETGNVRHTGTWYAKDGRAVLVYAHIFSTDDGFVGVMKGRQLQLDDASRHKPRQINLRLPEELIAAIEDLRGDMPWERFLRMVITTYVEAAARGDTPEW